MIGRVLIIASREFRATAFTATFIISLVFLPGILVIVGVASAAVQAVSGSPPPMRGTLAVVDRSEGDVVAGGLSEWFSAEAQARQRAEAEARARAVREQLVGAGGGVVGGALEELGEVPPAAEVDVEVMPDDTQREQLEARVASGEVLAAVIASEPTVEGRVVDAGDEAGSSELNPGEYTIVRRDDLRAGDLNEIREAVSSILRSERYRRAGVDLELVESVRRLPLNDVVAVVDEGGESVSQSEFVTQLLPVGFAFLLLMSSVMGGNYLLMGTLEEKSSRAMEVILSCVSPLQLMSGKLIGQGAVGLVMVAVYAAAAGAAAAGLGLLGQIPPTLILWLVFYFFVAYGFLGSLMLAVGSAVTEIREAQSLFAPVTASMIIPIVMMASVQSNPGSLVSRVFSHIPPGTPFVMVARLSDPSHTVPVWELVTTSLIAVASVVFLLWLASRVFRVGVLMYGKPPSLIGLARLAWRG